MANAPSELLMIEGCVRFFANTTGAITKRFFTHWWGRSVRIMPRTRQSVDPRGDSGKIGGSAIGLPGGSLSAGGRLRGPSAWITASGAGEVRAGATSAQAPAPALPGAGSSASS
jgi:hypothetical protein